MRAKNALERCSICLENGALTWEHIIPQSIGGTLESDIQCVSCNSELGTQLVSGAKSDQVIRLAIRNLKADLPELYESIEHGQLHVVTDVRGEKEIAKFKRGKLETKARKRKDGSIVLDTKRGERHLRRMLENDGLDREEVENTLQRFKNSPDNTHVRLSEQTLAVRWGVESTFPRLDAGMDERLVVLIAYNYLCLLLNGQVLDERLSFIRDFIVNDKSTPRIKVESFTSRRYEPYHGLCPKLVGRDTIITIRLFGWLIYEVHFVGVVYGGPDFVYVEDLRNRRGLLAANLEEAKRGEFHSTK